MLKVALHPIEPILDHQVEGSVLVPPVPSTVSHQGEKGVAFVQVGVHHTFADDGERTLVLPLRLQRLRTRSFERELMLGRNRTTIVVESLDLVDHRTVPTSRTVLRNDLTADKLLNVSIPTEVYR